MKHLHLTRVLAFALALVLLLGCTACGKKTADDTGDTVGQKDTQTTVELDGKFTLNYSASAGMNPYKTQNSDNLAVCGLVYETLTELTDAFEAEVGTDGAFTGIAAASSHVLCFKENCVHKIYGAKPSNFQVQVSSIPGVQAGCERAIRNVGETVYWWARDGLMAYGGGIPDRLSAPLGDAGYTDMCMGEDGHKLWLSGLRDGQPETLIYDIEQATFLPVDSRKAVQFAYHDGARYLAEETALWKTGTDRKNTDFAAVFGPFRQTSPAVLTGLTILADCVGECTLACAVRTERGDWMPVWASGRLSDGRARIPVPAVRGMQFWLRVTGRGDVTLQSIVRILHPDGPDDL